MTQDEFASRERERESVCVCVCMCAVLWEKTNAERRLRTRLFMCVCQKRTLWKRSMQCIPLFSAAVATFKTPFWQQQGDWHKVTLLHQLSWNTKTQQATETQVCATVSQRWRLISHLATEVSRTKHDPRNSQNYFNFYGKYFFGPKAVKANRTKETNVLLEWRHSSVLLVCLLGCNNRDRIFFPENSFGLQQQK